MTEFQQVEVCLECSAKQLRYVSDVFLHALKACLNPALPLFNPQADQGHGAFTPLFCKAFKRIFIVNDVDKASHPHPPMVIESRHPQQISFFLSLTVIIKSACTEGKCLNVTRCQASWPFRVAMCIPKIVLPLPKQVCFYAALLTNQTAFIQDGVISESELQNFQMSVFSTPLRPEDVSGILKAVGDQMPQVISFLEMVRQREKVSACLSHLREDACRPSKCPFSQSWREM